MKFLPVLVWLTSASFAAAVKCGTAISKPCITDTDIRYDAEIGYDVADQSAFWHRLDGFYRGFDTTYNVIDNVPTPDSEQSAVRTYINITVDGSRVYMHRYGFGGPGQRPALLDTYLVSTFEKDGTVSEMGRNSNERDVFEPFEISDLEFDGRAFGPFTGYFVGELGRYVPNIAQEFYTCVETDEGAPCTQLLSQKDMYIKWDGQVTLDRSKRLHAERITEDAYIKEVKLRIAWYDDERYNKLDPATDECATQNCPTEEQWRQVDPYYNESPYQEPDGTLEGWFVGLIVVLCIVVVVGVVYMGHTYLVKQREHRIKAAFAQSVAASIAHRCKAEDLTPEDMRKEFELIDTDGSGKVSMEEFHEFVMSSGKVTLDSRDFDVLYSTIDTNGDGEIDFSEFCAFFSLIRSDFNSAIGQRSTRNLSVRQSATPAPAVPVTETKNVSPAVSEGDDVEA